MDFVSTNRCTKRKRKRLRKRLRKLTTKVEVKPAKHWKTHSKHSAFNARETLTMDEIQADAFWKNYAASQEWQKRHNITWWRSRCIALEYENQQLRDKIRSLSLNCHHPNAVITEKNNYHEDNYEDTQEKSSSNSNGEDFEFHMTEDMLNFLETSERHRRELQQKHKSKKAHKETDNPIVISGAKSVYAKKKEAELLYADVASQILAMETALQVTVDRHKDTVNPIYWPNIPLKL